MQYFYREVEGKRERKYKASAHGIIKTDKIQDLQQANWRPKWSSPDTISLKIQEELTLQFTYEGRRRKKKCPTLTVRQEEFLLTWEGLFVLLRLSADWKWLTHIGQSANLNVTHSKHPHRHIQSNVWLNIWGPWSLVRVLHKISHHGVFPGGTVVKTPHSQCRGPRFNPWSGN